MRIIVIVQDIDTDHLPALRGERFAGMKSDKSCGTGYEDSHHYVSSLRQTGTGITAAPPEITRNYVPWTKDLLESIAVASGYGAYESFLL